MKDVCVITGGGSGMGLAAARYMPKEKCIVLSGRTVKKLEDAVSELEKLGYEAHAHACDTSDRESVRALAEYAASLGKIKNVIHAAGMSPAMASPEQLLRVNALGTVYVNQEFAGRMHKGSVIVDVSSNSAYVLPQFLISKKTCRLAETNEAEFLKKLSSLLKGDYQKAGFAYAIFKNFVVWYAAKCAFDYGKRGIQCRKMVYVSSTGVIPEQPKGTAIKEVDQFTPVDEKIQVGCYSQSKAMATQEVLDACRTKGLKACVVHPSGILGPKDYAVGETTGTIIKIMNGQMPVGMGGSFNLCDVRDLAAGCIGAADQGRVGECYILGNKEVTLKEVCKMLHDASGCKMPHFYVPIRMAYMLAAQMEKKARRTGEKPLMTNFAVYNLARNNEFDYSKAEQELGYRTRPYAETLKDEAHWLMEEGLVSKNE